MNEKVASYIMDDVTYDVYACYETMRDMDNRNVDFYDIYNVLTGECVNEFDPWFVFPSWQQVYERYYLQVN